MYVGRQNLNASMKLQKMCIINQEAARDDEREIYVLYNPESYRQQRSVNYAQLGLLGADAPIVQFQNGGGDVLSFELFFDTLMAGGEVGGTNSDRQSFESNRQRTSPENQLDVRTYTRKITRLMSIQDNLHRPPELLVLWASLQFRGFLASCEQSFLKFDEKGYPVRATLQCQFIEHRDINLLFATNPLGSPDTTKFRTVREGDSLWALAAQEYGDAGRWREIAAANGIVNPRRLRPGETLTLPALD